VSWDIVYERAIREDGSLYFPEKLNAQALEKLRRTMGSYIFANQYQNEIIPLDEMIFKPEWIKRYTSLPETKRTFAFIDPAISQKKSSDFTAIVVVDIDVDNNWYVKFARRYKLNPTEVVELCFVLYEKFKPFCIGIESTAFQQALLHMVDQACKAKSINLPIKGINHGSDESKIQRILGLVPKFEWGNMFLAQGLNDLEDELSKFPRSKYDDLIDALASIIKIASKPQKEIKDERPNPSDAGNYERWYRAQISKQGGQTQEDS